MRNQKRRKEMAEMLIIVEVVLISVQAGNALFVDGYVPATANSPRLLVNHEAGVCPVVGVSLDAAATPSGLSDAVVDVGRGSVASAGVGGAPVPVGVIGENAMGLEIFTWMDGNRRIAGSCRSSRWFTGLS